MLKLNRDIFYLIFEELQNDKNTLCSCLSVNKTWSDIIIPILWKNPWKYYERRNAKLLLNVIISHLSDESRDSLNLDTNSLTYSYRRPLFDYIGFCKHLNINEIIEMINIVYIKAKSKMPIITNEILNLFINKNTKFTHLYIPYLFDYQVHLIPGAKHCLSELEFLHCSTAIKDSALDGLLEMCKSIRILELYVEQYNNNHGIVKLIETPKKLYDVRFLTWIETYGIDESFYKILGNSLIKHANTIQYLKITKQPATKILSSFKNLKSLELEDNFHYNIKTNWGCLANLSLPFLQILRARSLPIEPLTSLIENTSGSLTEIKMDFIKHDDINNKRIIQVIYQKCPNLNYLKIKIKNSNLLELENLLIHCQHLDGLFIITDDLAVNHNGPVKYDWNNLFKILSKSSPPTLFKFKISFRVFYFEKSLELFFDNWKGRHPMLLQIISQKTTEMFMFCSINIIEKYKAKGIVKKFDRDLSFPCIFEDFEWIQKKTNPTGSGGRQIEFFCRHPDFF